MYELGELVHLRLHELGRLGSGHAVEVGHLVERPVQRALGGRTVVAEDVVHDGVLQDAKILEGVDQPTDVVIGVFEEPGVHLHLTGQHRLEVVGHVLPCRDLRVRARQLRLRWDHAKLALAAERALALGVPAIVELAGVTVGPFLRDVMRRMGRARCEVHEERLVRHQRLLLTDPAHRLIGQVLGQVVPVLGRRRRLDRRGALVQRRFPLVVLAADEPVEPLETAATGRPRVEGPHR